MKTLLLAAAAVLALGSAAHAQRFSDISGSRLAQICTSKNPAQLGGCTAYIDGIADSVAFYQELRPADKGGNLPAYICIPSSVTGTQLRQSVLTWFANHRDQGERQASGIVLRAMSDTYKCPGDGNRPAAPRE